MPSKHAAAIMRIILQAIGSPFVRKPPPILYHYTSQGGLLSMINNNCFWATHILYLNDTTEFKLAFSMLEQVIEAKGSYKDETEERFYTLLRARLGEAKEVDAYVFCFSQEGDLLSQWRAYCDKGQGFALGIRSEDLESWAAAQDFYLAPCLYVEQAQLAFIEGLVTHALMSFREQVEEEQKKGTSDVDEDKIADTWVHFFISRLFPQVAAVLKHPGFHEELEWHLISTHIKPDNDKLGFRPGITTITPYYKFEMGIKGQPLKVGEIVVGPTTHPDLAIKSLGLLLLSKQIKDMTLRTSTIPFRNW